MERGNAHAYSASCQLGVAGFDSTTFLQPKPSIIIPNITTPESLVSTANPSPMLGWRLSQSSFLHTIYFFSARHPTISHIITPAPQHRQNTTTLPHQTPVKTAIPRHRNTSREGASLLPTPAAMNHLPLPIWIASFSTCISAKSKSATSNTSPPPHFNVFLYHSKSRLLRLNHNSKIATKPKPHSSRPPPSLRRHQEEPHRDQACKTPSCEKKAAPRKHPTKHPRDKEEPQAHKRFP